jgi:hypothetical protein
LLTGGEAWNIAILSRKLRIANANCLFFSNMQNVNDIAILILIR